LNKDRSTDSDIVLKLRGKAAKGDVAAARELREWLERGRGTELAGDAWLARLTHEQRAQLRTWIEESEARELVPSRRDREGEDAPAQVTTEDETDASSEEQASASVDGDPPPRRRPGLLARGTPGRWR